MDRSLVHEWLSDGWVEAVAGTTTALPGIADLSGSVDLAISTAPRRETHLHWIYDSGQPTSGSPTAAGAPDLALTISSADAAYLLSGELEASVAFMRGRLKASGDGALLLGFLESTTDPAFGKWCETVRSFGLPGAG